VRIGPKPAYRVRRETSASLISPEHDGRYGQQGGTELAGRDSLVAQRQSAGDRRTRSGTPWNQGLVTVRVRETDRFRHVMDSRAVHWRPLDRLRR
jgi:hypothetical protein